MTIFYAIVGVPLCLLYLSNIGNIMATSFKWIYSRLCKCQLRRRRTQDKYRIKALPQQLHTGIIKLHEASQQGLVQFSLLVKQIYKCNQGG